MNRVGVVFYLDTGNILLEAAVKNRKARGPLHEATPGTFLTVQIDNVNISAAHAVDVQGTMMCAGIKGTATQAVNADPVRGADVWAKEWEDASAADRELRHSPATLEKFLQDCFRAMDEPLLGFTYFVFVLVEKHRAALTSKIASEQVRLRHLLLLALSGKSTGPENIAYVDMDRTAATDTFTLVSKPALIKDHYRPGEAEDGCQSVAVVGDQPVNSRRLPLCALFRLWHDAKRNKYRFQEIFPY